MFPIYMYLQGREIQGSQLNSQVWKENADPNKIKQRCSQEAKVELEKILWSSSPCIQIR